MRSAWEPWMSPRHPAELRDPAPVFCTGWHSPGPQGCIAAPPLCGDTTRLPLQRGCIVAASALAGIHHGYLRTPTYCIICSPLFFKQSRDASRVPPRMGMHRGCLRCSRDRISYKQKQKASSLAQALSTLVATRARSIEASDCDLRPFPDPSAPLGIERWLRSQRASAPRELMPRLHSPCNKNSKRRGALSWDASRLHSHVDTSAHSCVHVHGTAWTVSHRT